MHELAVELAADVADWFTDDIAEFEHLLQRHAAFDDYCAGKENDGSQETTAPKSR